MEAAAGLWARAFASATVDPSNMVTGALTPAVLAAMGRGLAVHGGGVWVIGATDRVTLTQASAWDIGGGARPEEWTYTVELPLPSGRVLKRTVPAGGVIHLRYATRPGAPHLGVSPLGMARETRALAGWLEKRLAEEASTTSGHVLAVPDGTSGGNVTESGQSVEGTGGQAVYH